VVVVASSKKKPAPVGQKKTGVRKTISLNDWDKPKEDTEEGGSAGPGIQGNDEFTEAQLRAVWQEYVDDAIRNNDLRKTTLFKGRRIDIEGNKISIKVDNTIQHEHLNGYKEELMLFIRKKLNNSGIILESDIAEVNMENKLYTSDDKFKHLAKKNSALEKLKKDLGLETGF